MTNLKVLQPEKNNKLISMLEDVLKEAKSGNLIDLAIVGKLKDSGDLLSLYSFEDRHLMIGNLEYLKMVVFEGAEN